MTKYGGSVGAAVSIALPDLAFAQGQVAPVLSCARLNLGLSYWGNISTYWTKQDMVAGFTNHVSDVTCLNKIY